MTPAISVWQFLSYFAKLGRSGPYYVFDFDMRAWGPSRGGSC